ncbi:MAG: hypothetical protein EOO21_06800 [Comamonadaceae bacterium]|nr:MAG: hypothetical protein EOO21_06800 [Comamonadaceae bacterium]
MNVRRSEPDLRRTPFFSARPLARRQAGTATVEYAIGTVFVCLFLFSGNPSPLEQLLTSIRQNHSATSYAIGSPTVGAAVGK